MQPEKGTPAAATADAPTETASQQFTPETSPQEIVLPRRGRGRPTAEKQRVYDIQMSGFIAAILEMDSGLDFSMSARGWGYYLEGLGTIDKGDIDLVEKTINDCRKSGLLPLDICLVDERRKFENLEQIDLSPELEAEAIVDYVQSAHESYTPFSFWDDKDVYVQMLVEKVDLKSLFKGICQKYRIPIANSAGWGDINGRADMMRRFAKWEARGKEIVLLYCGDFDPGGLLISDHLRSNMSDLAEAVGWEPTNLHIDRFGLNYDYISDQDLIWIENLITGSGENLASPKHPKHNEAWVQDYLDNYGPRKVEANALLSNPEAGRELCLQAILEYLPEDAPDAYDEALAPDRQELAGLILESMEEIYR